MTNPAFPKRLLFFTLGTIVALLIVWSTFLIVELIATQFLPAQQYHSISGDPSSRDSVWEVVRRKHEMLGGLFRAWILAPPKAIPLREANPRIFPIYNADPFDGKFVLHQDNDPEKPVGAVSVASSDSFSRRTTVAQKHASKHLVFFGGSFTYGSNVNDEDTLPSRTTLGLKDYQGYNYGYPGGGPIQMLSQLISRDVSKEIREKKGFTIYVWNDFHTERVFPLPSTYSNFFGEIPYLTLSPSNKILVTATEDQYFPLRFELLRFIWDLRLLHAFNLSLEKYFREDAEPFICALFHEAKVQLEEKLPESKFIFLRFPAGDTGKRRKLLSECLKQNQVPDISLDSVTIGPQDHLIDNHPSPELYKKTAAALAVELNLIAGNKGKSP